MPSLVTDRDTHGQATPDSVGFGSDADGFASSAGPESQPVTSDIAAASTTSGANALLAPITASTLSGYCCHHGSNADERSREEQIAEPDAYG